MDRGLKQLGLLALVLAILTGTTVYFAINSDISKTDRHVPGATTGRGKASLAD
jgi:hypothetical protein